jgi:hypothetical protein
MVGKIIDEWLQQSRYAGLMQVKGSVELEFSEKNTNKCLNGFVKDRAHRCIQSLRGVRMTNSEGLWPQLIRCAPHLSTVPLISDKVQ